mgnify:CR=1 FL=1
MRLKNTSLEKNSNEEQELNYLQNRVLNYLKFRPRTEKEIVLFLKKIIKKKNLPATFLEKIIHQLKEWGLINDKNFVDWFVSSRKKLHQKGKQLIIYELKQKGIDQKLIDNYFSQEEFNEEKLALQLIKKYSHRWQNLAVKKKKEKIIRFLTSRGFSFETIRKIIKN